MPFEDLTGSSGFTSDSEGANANLDITMSEDSARNLWDVQAAVAQIATDFQTAVRAASDFNSYLISIRETSQTVNMPSLGMEGGEGGNMSYSGGRVDAPILPSAAQSELGMASRISEMEDNSSGASGGALGATRGTGQRPVDVEGFVNQATQAAWLINSMGGGHQQHGGRGQPLSAAEEAAQRATHAIQSGLPAAQQFLRGGGLGGAMSAIGRFGTVGAVGYVGYQLVDAGLETYAQSRAMAISSNNSQNGAGWGFGQRISQAGMAMSPFISQEEAAQIYSSAVGQGWASRMGGFQQGNFGQAVNFMYGAAKDYNIDPTMSAQLLQTNVLGAGESIQALSQQLLTLKQTLDGTGVSMETATASFTGFTSFLITSGASPAIAAQIAGGALKGYAGNTYLGPSGRGSEIVQGTLQTQQTQNVLAGLTGTIPGAALAGPHATATVGELQKLTSRFSDQVLNMAGLDPDEKAAMFQQLYNGTFGTNISHEDASNLMAENAANKNLLTKGQQDYIEKGKLGPLQHQNAVQAWWHGLDDIHGWASSQTGHPQTNEAMEKDSALINSYQNYSPEVNTLLSNSGDLSNVVLYGPDGKPVMVDGKRIAGANIAKWFDDSSNYNKFNAAKSGYYIQDEKGAKYNASNIGTGGVDPAVQAGNASSQNTVYITLSAEAKKYFSTNTDKLNLDTGHN